MSIPYSSQSPLLNTFIPRLRNLHSSYQHLELDYARLPLSTRRHLYGHNVRALGEIRTLAEAKFLLAAVLQWSPSTHSYSVAMFDADRGTVVKAEGGGADELCPIWMNFFDELAMADHEVSRLAKDPDAAVSHQQVHSLILKAEEKNSWIETLFGVVAEKGEHIQGPCDFQLQDWMIYMGWNRFCFKVAEGVKFGNAIAEFRQMGKSSGPDTSAIHYGQEGRREFFPFTTAAKYEPWATFAAGLFGGSSVDWYAPCMLDYHPGCAADSPCRRPLDSCPGKARGEECRNGNRMRAVPWIWPCVPKQEQIERVGGPYYPTGYPYGDSPAEAGKLSQDQVCDTTRASSDSIPAAPSAILTAYNARWNAISHFDPNIPFPTISFELDDLLERCGLGMPTDILESLTEGHLIKLKTQVFFLCGFNIPYDIGTHPYQGVIVVPKLPEYDTTRVSALLKQLKLERSRWMAELLSQRTGEPRKIERALGDDAGVVAIRDTVRDMIGVCERKLQSLME